MYGISHNSQNGVDVMNKNLLKRIEERMPTFSKSQKLISNYILENYDKAAYMTASKLGAVVKVSESTVVRYAIELGFEGYPEFQHSLQEIVRTRLTSFQRMEVTNSLIGDGDILTKVLLSDIDKIKRTIEDIDHEAFAKAVDTILGAKNIYILGMGSSSILARALNINLRMMFDNVRFILATSASEIYEQIMSIGEDDVMVALSFPRYSKKVVSAVNFARNTGAKIVAITDSPVSPIAADSSIMLYAKSDMASFADSLVAPLSVINAIVVAISRQKQEDLTIRLRQLEKIWENYKVYDTNQG